MSLFLIPLLVHAEKTTDFQSNMGFAIAKTLMALLFVLALLFLFVYLLKRFSPKLFGGKLSSSQTTGSIELIDTKAIGPKRFVHLLQIGRRFILIGSSETGITRLDAWSKETESDLKDDGKRVAP